MTIAKAQLIDALRLRYDHYSAEAVFDIARQRVEIEDKTEYSVKEARSLRAAIELSGDRVGSALAAIDELIGGGGGDAAAPAKADKSEKSDKVDAKAEAAKADAAKAEAAKAEAAKAEAAKAEAAKAEAAKAEAAKAEAAKLEAAKADKSDKTQAAKPEAAKGDKSDKVEAAKADKSDKVEAAKADKSDKTEAAKADKSDKTQAAKSDGKAQDVEIVLKGVDVADGEQVLVCGAFDELGDWDPAKARPLVKKGDAWLVTVKLQPDTKVAFKFLRRTADGKVTWESGDDRHLTAPRVEATWR